MADDGREKQREKAAHIEAYSQRIIRLRRILPITAFLLLGLLVLAANPDFSRNLVKSKPENGMIILLIDRPVFDGRLTDGRPYRLPPCNGLRKMTAQWCFVVPN